MASLGPRCCVRTRPRTSGSDSTGLTESKENRRSSLSQSSTPRKHQSHHKIRDSLQHPEETIVVELSDATGKNDTFRYITYYEGRMNTPRGFDGESAAYNPYMNKNMAALYGGGYYSRSQRQQIRPHHW